MSDEHSRLRALTIDRRRLIIPALGGLYETFAPYAYAFTRFATGAILVPHGVQKNVIGREARAFAPFRCKITSRRVGFAISEAGERFAHLG
jgi:hypothetical protein